jgi:hypothetical protein
MTTINDWLFFSISFGLLLFIIFFMIRQGQNFYTKDIVPRKFSILELELPASAAELVNLIKGLYLLPPGESKKSIHALKAQLKLDFILMPFWYGCIFLLCWRVGQKMQYNFGHVVFTVLAMMQVLAWICDIIENVYLLSKINPDVQESSAQIHTWHLYMEAAKWGISLTATVCAISAISYFWLTGAYSQYSSMYLLIVIAEMIVFILFFTFLSKKQPVSL